MVQTIWATPVTLPPSAPSSARCTPPFPCPYHQRPPGAHKLAWDTCPQIGKKAELTFQDFSGENNKERAWTLFSTFSRLEREKLSRTQHHIQYRSCRNFPIVSLSDTSTDIVAHYLQSFRSHHRGRESIHVILDTVLTSVLHLSHLHGVFLVLWGLRQGKKPQRPVSAFVFCSFFHSQNNSPDLMLYLSRR